MATPVPEVIDLSRYRPKILNQGNVGRCVGCGEAGVISGRLAQLGLNPDLDIMVSPDVIYALARVMEGDLTQDNGAQPFDALTMTREYGAIPYKDVPLQPSLWEVDPIDTEPYKHEFIQYKDFNPVQIDCSNPDTALANILDAMAQVRIPGTQGTFINVGFNWPMAWENYSSGVLPNVQEGYQIAGGHDTYWYVGDSRQKLITGANSWDITWGIKGTYVFSMDMVPILAKYGSLQAEYVTFGFPTHSHGHCHFKTSIDELIYRIRALRRESLKTFGVKRASDWHEIRDAFIKLHPWCSACGATDHLEVHHIRPVHLFPSLEKDPGNFIVLCEKPGHDCHFTWGHMHNWGLFNLNVREDAARYYLESMKVRGKA